MFLTYCIISILFCLMFQKDFTLSTEQLQTRFNNNEHHPLTFVVHSLHQSFYKQPSLFLPDSSSTKTEILPEITNIDLVTETDNAIINEEIAEIMDEILEPQLPLSIDDQYIPFLNGTANVQMNCSQFNTSSVACEEVILHAPVLLQSAVIKAVILCTISVFSFSGNIATLTSILRTGRQNTSTVYMLLVQLTIADLLVTTFCILTDAIWMLTVQWYGGNLLCKAVKFMQMFALYLSTFVLVLIGFDRLCAVKFPMGRARAKKDVRKGIVCIWSLSALFSLPQAVIFSVQRGPFVEEFYQCVTFGFYTAPWQEPLYTMISLVLMFLLPLLILIITYITTFVTIASQENMFSERACRSAIDDARSKILHKAKVKSLMITVVIVLAFVFCWTPYYVVLIVYLFLGEHAGMTLQTVVFFFGSSTAAINPLIYGAFHLKRRRRKPRSSKSTSLNNNSSSSRVESSMMTLRKGRRSREESNGGGHMEFTSTRYFISPKNYSSSLEQTTNLM